MENTANIEKHIGYWLRSVSNQVSGAFAHALGNFEMSIGEWAVLNLLSDSKLSPAVIAKKVGMTRGAMSKVLDKLFIKQLIYRSEFIEDRRYQEVSISKKGKQLLPKLMKIADENDHTFFGHLSNKDKELLIKILKEIVSTHQWKEIPVN